MPAIHRLFKELNDLCSSLLCFSFFLQFGIASATLRTGVELKHLSSKFLMFFVLLPHILSATILLWYRHCAISFITKSWPNLIGYFFSIFPILNYVAMPVTQWVVVERNHICSQFISWLFFFFTSGDVELKFHLSTSSISYIIPKLSNVAMLATQRLDKKLNNVCSNLHTMIAFSSGAIELQFQRH